MKINWKNSPLAVLCLLVGSLISVHCVGRNWLDSHVKPYCAIWRFTYMSRVLPVRPFCQISKVICSGTQQLDFLDNCQCTAGLAMDCRVDLRWHFCCGCPTDFETKTSFWFPIKKIRGRFLFFRKVEKWARTAKNGVFGNFYESSVVLR